MATTTGRREPARKRGPVEQATWLELRQAGAGRVQSARGRIALQLSKQLDEGAGSVTDRITRELVKLLDDLTSANARVPVRTEKAAKEAAPRGLAIVSTPVRDTA